MVKVYIGKDSKGIDGLKLSEFDHLLIEWSVYDENFNIVKYLQKKKIINKSGEIIDDRFGMMNISERTLEPMFEEKIEKYIFIPNDRTNSLLREIIKDTEDSKDII